jgi:hypothetical protein
MAKATSAKKVARVAARSGGKTAAARQRNWLFPAAIVAIVALGIAVLVYARSNNLAATSNTTHPLANLNDGKPSDHWHAAFQISVCGKELTPVNDAFSTDTLGIHTHGDGLIHIHPFATLAAGTGAKMSRFFTQTNLKVTDTGFKMPDGKVYEAGKTTCNGKPAVLRLAQWDEALKAAAGAKPDQIYTTGFGGVHFTRDFMAFTLDFAPAGSTIPPPSTAAKLKTLGECDKGGAAAQSPECLAAQAQAAQSTATTLPPTSATTPPTTAATPKTTTTKGSSGK